MFLSTEALQTTWSIYPMLAPIAPTLSGLKTNNHFFLSIWSWAFSCTQTVSGDRQSLLHACAWHPGWENPIEGSKGALAVTMGLSTWPLHVVAWRTFTPASALQVIGPRETEPGKSWIVFLAWPHRSCSITYTMV